MLSPHLQQDFPIVVLGEAPLVEGPLLGVNDLVHRLLRRLAAQNLLLLTLLVIFDVSDRVALRVRLEVNWIKKIEV